MGFSEETFLFVFMPVSIAIYLLIAKLTNKDVVKNVSIALISIFFYYWSGKDTLWIFLQIVVFTYMAGYLAKRQVYIPIICLTGALTFYKYAAYLMGIINQIRGQEVIAIGSTLAPIGISFVVFEAISYVVDIYREDAKPGSLLDCATFLSLYPKLASGPIVLWKDFSPQLRWRMTTAEKLVNGVDRIIIGYAKKVILADTFGTQIALITSEMAVGAVDVPTVWLSALLYFFQIYFDFAGYSDIAIGLCSIFGFTVKENFKYPYLSTSISEFWRRWHISLGTWFREYVYIPLGGNRRGNIYLHLAVVFLLTGIWHGAGLQFLIWGGIQAVCVIADRAVKDKEWYRKIPAIVKWFATIAIVFYSWIIFKAKDMPTAVENLRSLFVPLSPGAETFTWRYYLSHRIFAFIILAVMGHFTGIGAINDGCRRLLSTDVGRIIKRIFLILLFWVDIMFVVNSTYSPFLYFQF